MYQLCGFFITMTFNNLMLTLVLSVFQLKLFTNKIKRML